MQSIWENTVEIEAFPALTGDIEAEAAVIGGGMAGLLTAYLLERKGISCIVLESGRVGGGVTGGTTAKITSQHGICYSTLTRQFGRDRAGQYARANEQALAAYARLIDQEKIDCDFRPIRTHLYATTSAKILEQEWRAAERLGLPASMTTDTELPFPVRAALRFEGQAEFHPMKFIAHLVKTLTVYEHTKALAVEGDQIRTDRGNVRARHIVVATHFPFINRPGYYFLRMHQERSYVLALEGAGQLRDAYLGVDGEGYSLRGWGDYVLLGGGNHRTGENKSGGKYAGLVEAAGRFFPESREICRWSVQDCMPHDNIPYIGRYGAKTENLYVATGFHKWGMTGSMAAATLLSDQIAGEGSGYKVFSPRRMNLPASIRGLTRDGYVSASGLVREIFTVPHDRLRNLPPGGGDIVQHEGEKVGAYRDEGGTAHLVSTQCPHLSCQLTWNGDEKSWDCPCHGSRFDKLGNRLDGPAQENLEEYDETTPYKKQREELL